MGQIVGRMPNTWNELTLEGDRVLHVSGEVLSKVVDNINEEESLQVDCDENIDRKIDAWMETNRRRADEILDKYPDAPVDYKCRLTEGLAQLEEEYRLKMRNDYRVAYLKIKKFTRKIDKLGRQQQRIHRKLQELETICADDMNKFKLKFGPLRLQTFKNLTLGEKLSVMDKKLKSQFIKQLYLIDHKNFGKCVKSVDKLIKDFEEAVRGYVRVTKGSARV